MLEISLDPSVSSVYGEVLATPYYQDGDIYRYASHLMNEDNDSSYNNLRQITENGTHDEDGIDENRWELLSASYHAITDALERLDQTTIPKPNFEAWVLQRIKSDEMKMYVEILDELFSQLALISYSHGEWSIHDYDLEIDRWSDRTMLDGSPVQMIDYRLRDDGNQSASNSDTEMVLNRNNPFADVSIKDQRFIYASDYNRFNALDLSTSMQLTKVEMDEEQSFVTLQPGFNIRNSPKVEGGAKSNIRFDDTLTTELTQDDDKTYVYLDVKSLSSE